MNLETILSTAWRETDEAILRFYTKEGKDIPDERLYKITTKWMISSRIPQVGLIGVVFYLAYQSSISPEEVLTSSASSFNVVEQMVGAIPAVGLGLDFYHNLLGLSGFFPTEETEVKSKGGYIKEKFQKASRALRLPVVGCGIYGIGKLCFDIYNTIVGDQFFGDIISDSVDTIAAFGLVTSMYLKDRDPKLLDKDPLWKRALDYVREKTEEMLPQPIPLPIPIPKAYRMQETPSL